jgi:23S rRNA (cytosine1962-C5)-methyltransferase
MFDAQTNGFRLIHGESDGWPGLVLDKYDSTLALKIYSGGLVAATEKNCFAVQRKNPVRTNRPPLEPQHPVHRTKAISIARRTILFGPPPNAPVIFSENGIHFEADVLRGQKTGFFLDQRENRHEVEMLACGRRVLNAFSFSGGFSVYAARGGAKSVTDLDISAHALESAKRNFELNKISPGRGSLAVTKPCRRTRLSGLHPPRARLISSSLIRHRSPSAL